MSFLIQNATLDAQGSIYPTFFDDFGKYEKSMIFRCRSERQKVDQKSSLGAPKAENIAPSNRRVGHFGHRGSQGGGHIQRYSRNINIRIEKQALTRHGPLARRMFKVFKFEN